MQKATVYNDFTMFTYIHKQNEAVSTPLPSANGRCHRYRVEMATERTAMQPHLLSRLRQAGFCSQLLFFFL